MKLIILTILLTLICAIPNERQWLNSELKHLDELFDVMKTKDQVEIFKMIEERKKWLQKTMKEIPHTKPHYLKEIESLKIVKRSIRSDDYDTAFEQL